MLPKRELRIEEAGEADFEPDIKYLKLLLASREADVREGLLFRQGKGYLCTPSAGHENMAALAPAIDERDYIYCHYRDRALLLARGVSLHSLALLYFAKKDSSGGGRQMAGHYSAPEKNIISCASPIASQCIPAVGTAWAAQLENNGKIVVCCMGEAGVRQGEFYEAFAFAVQEKLPIVFVVEDNGYGISTPTEPLNPFHLNIFSKERLIKVDGRIPEQVYFSMCRAAQEAREGKGPSILWVSFDRLFPHTSSDDHRLYRSVEELKQCHDRDPLVLMRNRLCAEGLLDDKHWEKITAEVREEVRAIYLKAETADEPDVADICKNIYGEHVRGRSHLSFMEDVTHITYAGAVTKALAHLLQVNSRVLMFGQDIEDPKGGVFGLTKGLSSKFPGRVINAPLAEATICGTAVGLAIAGYLPIFEIQFIDFMATGFNQIMNQMATLRWRTNGQLKCPLILLASCGGYIQGAGPWHTQTNESLFAHIPGLQVYMPSTAVDVADVIINSAAGDGPVLILLPKHLFFKEFETAHVPSVHHNQARILKKGNDVTIVAWGNCVELALEASDILSREMIGADVIDLKSIIPCDTHSIEVSLSKTGRLIVVHEDNKTCSFGQALISQMLSDREVWNMLYSPPQHVCRDDVLVPYSPTLARAVLPTVEKIVTAAREAME